MPPPSTAAAPRQQTPPDASTTNTHAAGSKTLALGVIAVLVLLIALFSVLWFTLDRQNRATQRADAYNRALIEVQTLLRSVDEIAVTEGLSSARGAAAEALKQLTGMQPLLEAGALDAHAAIDFQALSARATAFIAEKDVSVSNTAAIKSLGAVTTDAAKLRDSLTRDEIQARAAAQRAATLTRWLLAGAALISILGTALIFWMFHRRVTRPLGRAVAVAERISSGDLSLPVRSDNAGETARLMVALDTMQRRLARLALQVRETTGVVVSSATQVNSGNSYLSSRTQEQATTLEQTAASMEQISGSAREVADNTRLANDVSQKAVAAARAGGGVAANAVDKFDAIEQSAKRITEIIGVIDGIAFQTNILALNAAVEAARAGDQGRGFAVVATEVRALAQRSATAAREIKALIGASASHISAGTALIRDTGGAMKNIVAANEEVVEVISRIAAATAEQANSIDQINHAISQMENATQQNAAIVEQTAAAAETMRAQALSLQGMVERFKVAASVDVSAARTATMPQLATPAQREPRQSALPWQR